MAVLSSILAWKIPWREEPGVHVHSAFPPITMDTARLHLHLLVPAHPMHDGALTVTLSGGSLLSPA